MKYMEITDTKDYSENDVSSYITGLEGFEYYETARKSQIEYNWEWKAGVR
ncbi:MAG: hypothetical protein JXB88_00720 [Spirochaetales bacterium]|nr:hypothetical protein [Spirochaetales bacterium]